MKNTFVSEERLQERFQRTIHINHLTLAQSITISIVALAWVARQDKLRFQVGYLQEIKHFDLMAWNYQTRSNHNLCHSLQNIIIHRLISLKGKWGGMETSDFKIKVTLEIFEASMHLPRFMQHTLHWWSVVSHMHPSKPYSWQIEPLQ